MQAERTAAQDAIRSLRLTPVMFEDNARPHPPQEVYRRLLAQSDIFVGLYGSSYGWVGPEMQISGLEDEYNLSSSKPRLVYFRGDHSVREPQLIDLLRRIESEAQVCYKSFRSCEELSEFIKDDVMQLLSERFAVDPGGAQGKTAGPSYLDAFLADRARRPYLARPELTEELQRALAKHPIIVVTGEPGIGKTYLVASYAATTSAVYISVRNRTIQSVFSHVANQLLVRSGRAPSVFPSDSDARLALQVELTRGSHIIVIDDIDGNPEVFKAMLDLDLFQSHIVFTARDPRLAALHRLPEMHVVPFATEEVTRFLNEAGTPAGQRSLIDLQDTRLRNPLYLYYCAAYPMTELPESLASYQQALWQNLTPDEQDIVLLVAHSYRELSGDDIHDLRASSRDLPPTATTALVNALPLLQHRGSIYLLFHPYFEEFVIAQAAADGLARRYHDRLAALGRKRGWTVATAFHYYHAGDDRIVIVALQAAHALVLQGEWAFADDLLVKGIAAAARRDVEKDWRARAHYLRAHLCLERGLYGEARNEGTTALELLAPIDNDLGFRSGVQIWMSLLLVEEGRTDQAITELKAAVAQYCGLDAHCEAMARVHLAYVYIRTSQFNQAADEAARSLALFTELGDDEGVDASVTHLSNCLGGLNRRSEQRVYIDRMLVAAEKRGSVRARGAALNHLAGWLRKNKQPVEAKKALEEAVTIARRLGSFELEVLYTANLGNTFRDLLDTASAERCYSDSINLARQHGVRRWEGYGMEMLGLMRSEQGRYDEALQLSADALAIHELTGEQIRVATVLDNLGTIYYELKHFVEGAKHEQRAGDVFLRIEQYGQAADAYAWATRNWHAAGDLTQADRCSGLAIEYALQYGNARSARTLIERFLDLSPPLSVGSLFIRVLPHIARADKPFVGFVHDIAAYAKRHQHEAERATYRRMLTILLAELHSEPRPDLFIALASGVEQATEQVIAGAEWEQFTAELSRSFEFLYYSPVRGDIRVWTVGTNWQKPTLLQLYSTEDNNTVRKLALALALVFQAESDFFQNLALTLGQTRSSVELLVITESDAREYVGIEWPQNWTLPVAVGEWEREDSAAAPRPIVVIVKDDYDEQTDWNDHPDNNGFLIVIALSTRALLAALTGHNSESDAIREGVTSLIHRVGGTVSSRMQKNSRKTAETCDVGNVVGV